MKKHNTISKFSILIGLSIIFISLAGCATAQTPASNSIENSQSGEILPANGSSINQTFKSEDPDLYPPEVSNPLYLDDSKSEVEPAPFSVEPGPENFSATEPQTTEETTGFVFSEPAPQPEFEGPLPPVDPTIGNLAPSFVLTTLDGQTINLEDLRGRPVVVNYWVTWCIPCRDEMPAIETIQNEYRDQGLVVLSINGTKQDTLPDINQFLGEIDISFPVLLDQNEEVYNTYRVLFMPTSFFIDPRGVIQDIVLGSTDEQGFRSRVEKLVDSIN